MDRIGQALSTHKRVGLDTPVFIYHLEAHPDYLPLTTSLLTWVRDGESMAVTSTLTLLEILVRPLQLGHIEVADEYELLLSSFPHLEIQAATRPVVRRAAELRADYHLKPVDAVQIATTLETGGTMFVTNDQDLRRLAPQVEIVILKDFIER
jgi:predicted nucleic acid-binding protein